MKKEYVSDTEREVQRCEGAIEALTIILESIDARKESDTMNNEIKEQAEELCRNLMTKRKILMMCIGKI